MSQSFQIFPNFSSLNREQMVRDLDCLIMTRLTWLIPSKTKQDVLQDCIQPI